MARPFKGEAYYRDKHMGCRVLTYPIAERLGEISREKGRPFGSLCNTVIKKKLTEIGEYTIAPEVASLLLEKRSATNPKKDFTLYLTQKEHENIILTSKSLGISQNQLVTAFLCDYINECEEGK